MSFLTGVPLSSLIAIYRYFGRAKDLPGVRELFQSRKVEEDEENQTLAYYKKFMNQGPAYYGDLDEDDSTLLESERLAEEEGMFTHLSRLLIAAFILKNSSEWEEAYTTLREALGLPEDDPIPKMSRLEPPVSSTADGTSALETHSKRKAGEDGLAGESGPPSSDKRPKTTPSNTVTLASTGSAPADQSQAHLHAQTAASYIPFLSTEHLLPPKMPTRVEMEQVLLDLKKKALVEEYFGDEKLAAT